MMSRSGTGLEIAVGRPGTGGRTDVRRVPRWPADGRVVLHMNDRARAILDFWLGTPEPPASGERWFRQEAAFDDEIRARFGADLERAAAGGLDAWAEGAPEERLACVILLDQFSRNVFRGTSRAFALDGRALAACLDAHARGDDRQLAYVERYFLCMPMMHAEDRSVQRLAVDAFRRLEREARTAPADARTVGLLASARDYAERHAAIVERFGRFPHRNEVLGRESTPDEAAFLEEPGSRF